MGLSGPTSDDTSDETLRTCVLSVCWQKYLDIQTVLRAHVETFPCQDSVNDTQITHSRQDIGQIHPMEGLTAAVASIEVGLCVVSSLQVVGMATRPRRTDVACLVRLDRNDHGI